MSTWIDFKELRAQLDFVAVLRHHGVEPKVKGEQHHGFCPLPNHNGKKNSPSFSANVKKGIFKCFGCGAQGNIIDFSAFMQGLNPKEGRDLHKAALGLNERLCPESKPNREKKPITEPKSKPVQTEIEETKPLLVNAPLDFELQNLDTEHPYLADRNLTPETIKHFGLGFCSRGYFKERAVIPLHSKEGFLIGYAGRLINDSEIGDDNPKYLFPGTRERSGIIFPFRNGDFLNNLHRLKSPVDDLIVTEGFFSVHWLHQCGCLPAVGLMGWACSPEQVKLIVSHVRPGGRVWILADGDEAGERCAVNVFQLVAPQRAVRWVRLDGGKQPTDYSEKELRGFLK